MTETSTEPKAKSEWTSGVIGGAAGALGTAAVATILSFVTGWINREPIPAAAIIFVSGGDCGKAGNGWKKFERAEGRFLVGAGANRDHPGKLFEAGTTSRGNVAVKLEERNIPPLKFVVPYGTDGIGIGGLGTFTVVRGIGEGSLGGDRKTAQLAGGGQSESFDTLPPSIALTACQRS